MQVFNVDTGALVRTIGTTGQAGAAPGPLNYPSGVAIHPGADGATLLFVSEYSNNRVQVFGCFIDIGPSFNISLVRQDGEKFAIRVFTNHCASDLKQIIQDKISIPMDQQTILHRGRVVCESSGTLRELATASLSNQRVQLHRCHKRRRRPKHSRTSFRYYAANKVQNSEKDNKQRSS